MFYFSLYDIRSRNFIYKSRSYKFSTKSKSFRLIATRMYSTSKKDDSLSRDSSDSVYFLDADKDKLDILKYAKGKSGIYL